MSSSVPATTGAATVVDDVAREDEAEVIRILGRMLEKELPHLMKEARVMASKKRKAAKERKANRKAEKKRKAEEAP